MSERGKERVSVQCCCCFFGGHAIGEGTGQVMLQNYPNSLNDFLYAFPRLQKVRGGEKETKRSKKNERKGDTTERDIEKERGSVMSSFTINGYTDAFLFLTDDNQLSMTENGSAERKKK